MDSKIYTDKDNGLLITTRIEKWERDIQLGISPDFKFQLIDISDIDNRPSIEGIAYDVIPNEDFILLNSILGLKHVEGLAIHESIIIDSAIISCTHFVLGEKVKFELRNERLNSVERITFLSLKTFKGKIIDDLIGVKHLVVWEDKKSIMNDLLKRFPNLESLYLVRTSLESLDFSANPNLINLELHDCRKLKDLKFDGNIPENIVVEMCPNLIV